LIPDPSLRSVALAVVRGDQAACERELRSFTIDPRADRRIELRRWMGLCRRRRAAARADEALREEA
jgi:hypothetical protein